MKKSIITGFCITLFIAFLSCNDNSQIYSNISARDTIHVNNAKVFREIQYSNIFDRIDYIPLPIDSTFLIGKVNKLLVTDEYIFIMDKDIARSVFCFDYTGKKIFTIQKQGVAPGEYIAMNDIAYDARKKELIIYCYIRQQLLYYDMKGNFIRESKVPYHALRILPFQKNLAFYCDYYSNDKIKENGLYPNVFLTSSDYSCISKAAYFKSINNKSIIVTSKANFSSWDDTLSIKPDHSNIVYHLTNDSVYPAYFLDFGKYGIDKRYWDKAKERGLKIKEFEQYCKDVGFCESFRFLEGKDLLFFVYNQSGKVYDVLYSKKTKSLVCFDFDKWINDMDFVTKFRPIAIHNDKFYCLLESEDAYRIKELSIPTTIPKEVIDNVQEFGNPIIAVFTLKPF